MKHARALILILLVAFALRVHALEMESIWHDEAWTLRTLRDPFGPGADPNTPPLFYLLLNLLWRGAGESAFALRYAPVLLNLIGLALSALLARRWAGRDAMVTAGALYAVWPLVWRYGREFRAYALLIVLFLLLLLLADAFLRRVGAGKSSRRVGFALLAAELALLYTHNTGALMVGWLNLTVIAALIYRRHWRHLGAWFGGQALLFAAYLPWLLTQGVPGAAYNVPPKFDLDLIASIWRVQFVPVLADSSPPALVTTGIVIMAALALILAVVLLRRRAAFLILTSAVVLPALSTAMLLYARVSFHPRYFAFTAPAFILLIAVGAASLPRRTVLLLAMLVCAITSLGSIAHHLTENAYRGDDVRAIAHYYADLPPDALIIVPYPDEPALDYYAERLEIGAKIAKLPYHAARDEVIAAVNAALEGRTFPARVELYGWSQIVADARGMLPCLLESAGARSGRIASHGVHTTAYTVNRPIEAPQPLANVSADFGAFMLQGAAITGADALCVETRWLLNAPNAEDWRVLASMATTDPPGILVKEAASEIRTADQIPTAFWEPGTSGAAYTLIRFPRGAPPGDYAIHARIFSESNPSGLDRLIAGAPAGKDAQIAEVSPPDSVRQGPPPADPAHIFNPDHFLVGWALWPETVAPGSAHVLKLEWYRAAGRPYAHVVITGECGDPWGIAQPVIAYDGYSLDWHTFTVPANAAGEMVIAIESADGRFELGRYLIAETDRTLSAPPYQHALGAKFEDWAVLEGFSLEDVVISTDKTLDLTLIWRVVDTPGTSYKVFTHLLDSGGRLIAQHDSFPKNGSRPTTGWYPGEYILDLHALAFLDAARGYSGPARIEIGLYDPSTGERVPVSGADHIILPVEITIR